MKLLRISTSLRRDIRLSLSSVLFVPLFSFLIFSSGLHAQESVEDLCNTLHDRELRSTPSDQGKREVAIHKLARRDNLKATKCLTRVLADPHIHIQQEAVFWMQDKLTSKKAIDWLAREGVQSRNPTLIQNVLRTLSRLKNPDVLKHLKSLANVRNKDVLIELARTVRRLEPETVPSFLYKFAEHRSARVQAAAFRALGVVGSDEDTSFIQERLDSLKRKVLSEACLALGSTGGRKEIKVLKSYTTHSSWRVRLMALRGIHKAERNTTNSDGRLSQTFKIARKKLKDENWHVRVGAIDMLVSLWEKRVIPALMEGFKDSEGRLKLDYLNALQSMTGEDFGMQAVNWASWWQQHKSEFELGEKPDNWRYGISEEATKGETTAFFGIPLYSNRLMFVMDFSGGMKGTVDEGKFKGKTKIGIAKRELLKTIKNLRSKQRFNVLIYRYLSSFPSETKMQSPYKQGRKLFPASRRARAAAFRWVQKLEARGWGAFYEAFRAATVNPEVDTIVFLSDGKPTRGKFAGTSAIARKRFFEALNQMNRYRQVMIHTVLTGAGAGGTDADFLKRIANETGGFFEEK